MGIFRRTKKTAPPDPRKVAFEQAMERLGHPITTTQEVLDDYLAEVIPLKDSDDSDLLAIATTVGVTR